MQPRKELPWEFPRYIFKLDAAKALVEAHVQKRLVPLDPWQHVGRDQDDSQKAVGAMTCPAMVSCRGGLKASHWDSRIITFRWQWGRASEGTGTKMRWSGASILSEDPNAAFLP